MAKKKIELDVVETTDDIENIDDKVVSKTITYKVITEREPFWDGKKQPKDALIEVSSDDPAIVAMLERGWIKKA